MGKCPNCGKKAFGMRTFKCKNCGKEICHYCGIYLFKLYWDKPIKIDLWYVCSEKCFEEFTNQLEKHISSIDVGLSETLATASLPIFLKQALLALERKEYLGEEFSKIESGQKQFRVEFGPLKVGPITVEPVKSGGETLRRILEKRVRLKVAQNLIRVGNFEAAARIYEKLGLYDEAGKVRASYREIKIKKTEITVDLNKLVQQIRESGIVLVYSCPNCGGKLQISKETTVGSLKVCPYCGSELEVMKLADFLKTALS